MEKLRFSMRGLLIGTAGFAIACGALVSASQWIASLIFSATLAVLIVAVLGAVLRRGRPRAFWIGFAIVGWGYLWLAHTPINDAITPAVDKVWRLQDDGPLLTTKLLEWVYDHWIARPSESTPPSSSGGGMFGSTSLPITRVQFGGLGGGGRFGGSGAQPARKPNVPTHTGPELKDFLRVGQSLFALLFAYGGGLLGCWFYDRELRAAVGKK